ncbi:MAG: hypothetical protein DSZ11_00455 [Sulfurovum sp.]|nr:MAG: hypothetical protein DSZ11_00455 [Sulfurovum sp.]
MKHIQRSIIRLLLLFYLSSSYLSATHIHHETTLTNPDCKVCIMVKNINSGDTPSFEILTPLIVVEAIVGVRKTQPIIATTQKGYFSHAPPLFS